MSRVLLCFLALCTLASCFVANQAGRVAPLKPLASRSAPTMMVEDAAAGAVAAVTTTIATTAGDFGGYTIPIVGLFLLAATISFLAGPLED
jgi:hypothetical protein